MRTRPLPLRAGLILRDRLVRAGAVPETASAGCRRVLQGDKDAERALLRQVLNLLKAVDAKDPQNLNGLTGKQTGKGKASDEKLRKLLETILTR